ncbi:MAG TPA: hypothetical protein VFB00_01120 [Terriglobales bacterium]|nr:hypothetical protein [Terriglobales bacterium]
MRKAMLFSAAVLLCGALAFAQETTPGSNTQTPPSTSQSTATTGSSSTSGTFIGCLSGSSGHWMLTDSTGTSYQLKGDESQLSSNLNKQVEVTGTVGAEASATATTPESNAPSSSNAPSASNAPGNPSGSASSSTGSTSSTASGASASASATKTIDVTSVKSIADTCSNQQQTTPQQ